MNSIVIENVLNELNSIVIENVANKYCRN